MGRLTGERRAVAAAVLAMYGFLFLLVTLQAPVGWAAAFGAMAGIYAVGFLGVVAGYFWARWYSIGLGLSGLMTGVISLVQIGALEPTLVFYTATHTALAAILWGNGMSKLFDGRPEWRKRFHLDETATNRLGKSIIRIGASLPYVVLYALAPREGAALAIVGGAAVLAGTYAMFKMRTWALPALAGGAAILGLAFLEHPSFCVLNGNLALNLDLVGLGAIVLTTMAIAPFAGPVLRFLRQGEQTAIE